MKVIFLLIYCITILYSCAPINKQHGYLIEDMVTSAVQIEKFNIATTTKNDILMSLGSPSIKIGDVNNIWIYLISIKEQNIFEKDDIIFQSIIRLEFDDSGVLLSKTLIGEKDFTEISFSKDTTRVSSDNYGITDQILESFTRGQ